MFLQSSTICSYLCRKRSNRNEQSCGLLFLQDLNTCTCNFIILSTTDRYQFSKINQFKIDYNVQGSGNACRFSWKNMWPKFKNFTVYIDRVLSSKSKVTVSDLKHHPGENNVMKKKIHEISLNFFHEKIPSNVHEISSTWVSWKSMKFHEKFHEKFKFIT
jgi:hypothetical protein